MVVQSCAFCTEIVIDFVLVNIDRNPIGNKEYRIVPNGYAGIAICRPCLDGLSKISLSISRVFPEEIRDLIKGPTHAES
jgi:hypothetical protein